MHTAFSLTVAAATVAMEAGGESYTGQLAVAWVLANRYLRHREQSLSDVCFRPWQFSCWNTDSPTRMNLDARTEFAEAACQKAVLGAIYHLEPDPTNGAIFFLNKRVVIATAGNLPPFWETDGLPSSEITIGSHSFRRHR